MEKRHFLIVVIAVVCSVSFLAACGGGGGGSAPPQTYTVIYNGNGNTSGSVPVDTARYASGAAVTVLGNTGVLVRSGYVFAGWNTAADGSGTTYSQAQTFTMGSANVTLYAKWTAPAASLRVRVVDYTNAPVPDATVVLGDSDGAMLSSGTTDSNGEYTFNNPPLNATVTSIRSSGTAPVSYGIDIAYDVNSSAVTLGLPVAQAGSTAPTPIGPPLGTLTLTVSNVSGSATRNTVFIGNSKYASSDLVTAGTYTVNETDKQSDGNLSIFVVSFDANDQPLHYGALLDQTYSNGMSISIPVDQPVGVVHYQLTSIPTASMITEAFFYSRKGINLPGSVYSTLSSTSTATLVHYYIPGVGGSPNYSFTVHDGNWRGLSFHCWGAEVFNDHSVDMSHPTMPSNLMVSYATGTATATLSWSGADAGAGVLYGYGSADTNISFSFTAALSRSSIRFPQLPDSVAGARPTGLGWFMVNEEIVPFLAGYEDFLAKWDQLSSGTWNYPTSGISRTSYDYYGF